MTENLSSTNNMEEITMAKLQDSIRKKASMSHDVDLKLQDLIYKVAIAECNVDSELKYVGPLLKVGPEDAKDVALRVNNSIKRVKFYIKIFKSAHANFVEKIKEYDTGDEEEMNITIKE